MPFWLVKSSLSPERNPLEMETVAEARVVLSGSVTTRLESATTGPPAALYWAVPPAVNVGGVSGMVTESLALPPTVIKPSEAAKPRVRVGLKPLLLALMLVEE